MSPTSDPYSLIPVPPPSPDDQHDNAEALYIDMILIHNVLIVGFNSIAVNAPLVRPGDEYAFAGYSLACTELVHTHHDGEESILFPFLQTKLDMSHNQEQHEAFGSGMAAFETYMRSVQSKTETYNKEKVQKLLNDFADILVQHLHDEISTITPEKLRTVDQAGFAKALKDHEAYAKSHPGLFTIFPFVMVHHDHKATPNWPPIPAPLRWFARNIAGLRHPSYWKFAPYKFNGDVQVYAS
ncbi:hypothetical protein BDQ12DRAFT_692248 [Crucibulum laeve]|uniref:Hemerythrin-like domain-containing protein n=1 Tax=Crucibulum laeve TaxID=68775 RepID=A0A5C3LHR3_9AGAR|nr:hypothetical protein BDQ12DRAFT_692248 [Crucibulum laeve]